MNNLSCPACGGTELTDLGEVRYNTGVSSEDGYHERVEGTFAECETCGARFDTSPPYRAGLDFELALQNSMRDLVTP